MEKRKLSSSQQNIWNMIANYGDSHIANIGGEIVLSDFEYSKDNWTKVLNLAIKNNDSFRMQFFEEVTGVYQQPKKYVEKEFEELDLSNKSQEELEELYQEWMNESLPNNEVAEFKILKFNNNKSGIFVKINHIVCDGFSIGLGAQQILSNYAKLSRNEELVDVEMPSYEILLDREENYYESEKLNKDKEYYNMEYTEEPNIVSMGLKQTENTSAKRYKRVIANDKALKIKEFCLENNISEAAFFETVVFTYLKKISNNNSITIGSPVLNRKNVKEKNVIGMFVSTNPLKIEFEGLNTFRDLASAINNKKMELFRRQEYPFANLQNDIHDKFGYSGKLFDVVVSYQNAKIFDKGEKFNSKTNWVFNGDINNSLVINIDDRDENNEFVLNLDYLTDVFTRDEIENIVNRFDKIIEQLMSNVNLNINNVSIMTEKDIQMYKEFNNSELKPINETVIDHFEKQVILNGSKPALEYDGKVFTYEQLNNLANSLSNDLLKSGYADEEIIPIVGNRSYYTIISLLAVAKLGRGYFIIDDTQYPKDRIDYLIDEVSASKILRYNSNYEKNNVELLDVDKKTKWNENNNNLDIRANSEDIFCAIHTSGSTGKPKVAVVTNAGVVNMVKNNEDFIDKCDSLVSLITMSFDAFLEDTFLSLANGKKLVLTTNQELVSISSGENLIGKQNKCLVNLTPTRAKQYLSSCENDSWKKVGTILLGGEKIDGKLLNLINEKCDNPDVYNLYGPTETTVFNTRKKVHLDNTTVGKPITNFKNYIVDKNNAILPPGVIGEICVSGIGVAKGYYGRKELTAEKFFVEKSSGFRVYKTGDFGYIDENCELNFVGRMDNQIKINGLRIEMEEVEKTICTIEGVEESVISIQNNNEEKYLVCFYVSNKEIDSDTFRLNIEKTLPSYMVPQAFIKIDKIPLTNSGKINKKELPKVNFEKLLLDSYVKPDTMLERKICSIWEKVLEKAPIGINTPFSSLGGTSKLMIDMILQVEKLFDLSLNPGDFSKNPTVKDICNVLENKNKYNDIDLSEYKIESLSIAKNNNRDGILLTGAGGFLGAHLLKEFLEESTSDVYCLIRNEEKFNIAIEFYFGNELEKFSDRLHIIKGDLSKENFGLSCNEYKELSTKIGKVVNSAANVSHFSSVEDSKRDNVDSVYNIIKFSSEGGATIEQMSTVTISGIGISNQNQKNSDFTEKDLDIGQDYSHDAYMLSKFKSEQLLHKYIELGGRANIYRLGYVNNRSYDGKFQINEDTSAFKMILSAVKEFGIIPESAKKVQIQVVAVDRAASAITEIIKTNNNNNNNNQTFHIYNPEISNFCDYLDNEKINYIIVPDEKFIEKASNFLENNLKNNHSIAYKYLKSFLESPTENKIKNELTMEYLNYIGFDYNSRKEKGK